MGLNVFKILASTSFLVLSCSSEQHTSYRKDFSSEEQVVDETSRSGPATAEIAFSSSGYVPTKVQLYRLTNNQVVNIVNSIFKTNLTGSELTEPVSHSGYLNNAHALSFASTNEFRSLNSLIYEASENISSEEFLKSTKCASMAAETCMKLYFSRVLSKAFKRQTTMKEVEPFYGIYRTAMKTYKYSPEKATQLALQAILTNYEFIFHKQDGEAKKDGNYILSDRVFLTRASLVATDSLPSDKDLLKTSEIVSNEGNFTNYILELLKSPKGEAVLKTSFLIGLICMQSKI